MIDGDNATVRDCYLSQIPGYKNDQPVRPLDTRRRLVTVTFVRDAGIWKVSAVNHEADGCTAA